MWNPRASEFERNFTVIQHLDNSIFLSCYRHFTVNCSHNRGSNFKKKNINTQIFLATECIASVETSNAFEFCPSPCVKSFSLLVYLFSYGYHSVEQNLISTCQLYICVWVKGKKKPKLTPKLRSLLPMAIDRENKFFLVCLFFSVIVLFKRSFWGIEFLLFYSSMEDANAW